MNKRKRLEATISGEPVDRVAAALWRHWPGDDQRAEDQAAAHICFQRDYDWDFVKVTPASSFCLTGWGVEDHWEGNLEGTRRYAGRVIETSDAWSQLRVLEPTAGGLGSQLRCLEILKDEFKQEVPYIQTIFSPLAQAKNLAGDNTLIVHLRQNAGQVHHALQVITDTTIAFIHEAKRRGIAGIYYAIQHASYVKMTEAEYQVFGKPYDLQILAAVNDLWLNTLHIHGSHIMFSLLADYPVQIVNWHDRETPPELENGLKKIKGAASGGISRDVLHRDDPEPAIQQARDAMRQTGGRRWILGTGCVVLTTTPIGNIRKIRSLVEEL
ncbi:MAG: uroporphyrinogen decarboxylase [Anaerolineae bacterium]|nr:uroporphyrinogen decarboxylase [Anaerolineae bacterium]